MNTANLLSYELSDSIATITMDDGKANVMSGAMLAALGDAFDQAERDASVVVLTGKRGLFSGGYDMAMFASTQAEIARVIRAGGELVYRILSFPKPVLIACTGHAIAQGAFILLAGDVRIGVSGDRKIGLNEVALGLTIPFYGIEVARQRLTPAWFNHACVTAALYDPETARTAGFLDQLVAPDELAAATALEAKRLASLNAGAHAAVKLRVRKTALMAMRAGIDAEFPVPGGD
jgi:enoyl-CoA hydratase